MTRKESGWVREPFWHAVVSTSHPVINKAIRREDVATEYADKCAENYPDATDIEVVPLYRADALTSLQSAAEGLEEALEVSRIAIDDWLNTYAAELCDETRVHEARERIKEASGTLAYIAAVQTANRAALAAFQAIKEK